MKINKLIVCGQLQQQIIYKFVETPDYSFSLKLNLVSNLVFMRKIQKYIFTCGLNTGLRGPQKTKWATSGNMPFR